MGKASFIRPPQRACMAFLLALAVRPALAQYEPPQGYYNGATGTGATLKSQLHTIIRKDWFNASSSAHRVVSYSSLPSAFAVTDRDPNNASRIILVYTGQSVSNVYNPSTLPWNREHTWPDSRGINGSGPDYSDLHHLRPCDTDVNQDRGSMPFGIGSGYWDPNQGANDRGDMARAMFYMDTRYEGGESGTTNLALVNGAGGSNQMGDLARLLQWHYQDPPSVAEKRRNQLVFDKTLNPTYYQGNRNPFIDRPEYVWTIFGGGSNNSRLHVGSTSQSDGASTATINLGRVMRNGALGLTNVTLNKTGSHPTTYDLTLAGNAASSAAGTGQTFDYGAQSRQINVTLNASTATTGLKTGSITINNTDLSSGGAGLGSNDANDSIHISASVVDNRTISATLADFGRVIGNKLYTAATTLSTSGDDSSFTRVTVNGAALSSGNITVEAAAAKLFDDPTDTTTRTLAARFRTAGLQGGVIPLPVAGEGLAGETVQPLSVAWSAHVMPGVDEGIYPAQGASLTIAFGDVDPMTEQSRSFPLADWLETAGLEIAPFDTSFSGVFDDAFTLALGDELLASLDTSQYGSFDSVHTFLLSDGLPLAVSLSGNVVPEPTTLPPLLAAVLLRRRRVR